MKHRPYLAYYNPIGGMQTYRCEGCPAEVHLGVFQLEDEDCPGTGAPDWVAIDAQRQKDGFERIRKRMKESKPEPEKLRCDDCKAEFDDTDAGADALWSHCCVTTWD